MLERLTGSARHIIDTAQRRSRDGASATTSLYLLEALAASEFKIGVRLRHRGIAPSVVRRSIARAGEIETWGELNDAVKAIVTRALRFALSEGMNYVEPEHLAMAMAAEPCEARDIMREHGFDPRPSAVAESELTEDNVRVREMHAALTAVAEKRAKVEVPPDPPVIGEPARASIDRALTIAEKATEMAERMSTLAAAYQEHVAHGSADQWATRDAQSLAEEILATIDEAPNWMDAGLRVRALAKEVIDHPHPGEAA